VSCSKGRCAVDGGCTTRQHKTHSSDCRELRYPWHPWHGRRVWISRSSARGGSPVFQCSLDPDSRSRLLEIPQWMFDASRVCLIRLATTPVTSCEALRELGELIRLDGADNALKVLQAQHRSLARTGGSDAKRSTVTSGRSVAVVSAADGGSSMGEFAARDSPPSADSPRQMVTRRGRRKRIGGNRGGA